MKTKPPVTLVWDDGVRRGTDDPVATSTRITTTVTSAAENHGPSSTSSSDFTTGPRHDQEEQVDVTALPRILYHNNPLEHPHQHSEGSHHHNQDQSMDVAAQLREYYEIDRLVEEIKPLMFRSSNPQSDHQQNPEKEGQNHPPQTSRWLFKLALQFPDELLSDAPEVCWQLETALGRVLTVTSTDNNRTHHQQHLVDTGPEDVLVAVLADTTYAPCCPDLMAAAHMQADCLVHYGPACLSHLAPLHVDRPMITVVGDPPQHGMPHSHPPSLPPHTLPILYSWGRAPLNVAACVQAVLSQAQQDQVRRILLLHQLPYQHAMEELQTLLSEQGDLLVVTGEVPPTTPTTAAAIVSRTMTTCSGPHTPCACQNNTTGPTVTLGQEQESPPRTVEPPADAEPATTTVAVGGGLHLPANMDWSDFSLLFIGSDTSRQYLNMVLRFLSQSESCPQHFWTWRPEENQFLPQLSDACTKRLHRRFYLIQKAKQCSVFGILVANLSDSYSRSVVTTLRQTLQDQGRASYTLVVGKLTPAKLANFAEMECLVLVACPEHSWLPDDQEREHAVPVITPLELYMALGMVEWGSVPYLLNVREYMESAAFTTKPVQVHDETGADNDNDAPYFSLVSGQYEAVPSLNTGARFDRGTHTTDPHDNAAEVDMVDGPGRGQLTEYHSAAAEFLKQRAFQGLQVDLGQTEVRPAVQGQSGIASNYGQR